MVDIRACSDTGLPADAARILLHPVTALWTAETNSVLREIAAGKRPLPALMCRNLVVRAARALESRP